MKAVVFREYGAPDVGRVEVVESPALKPGSVRIRIHAAALGFANLVAMRGEHQNKASLPFTPGTEAAGEVIECAADVDGFKVGDRVIAGMSSGAFAEEAVVPVETVFLLPASIPYEIGAQFPTIYATAYAAFAWRAALRRGEWVLVLGAAGGSGLAAVEVANAMGARVIAAASNEAKFEALISRGAAHAIKSSSATFREQILRMTDGHGVDIVYDPVGGEQFRQALKVVASEARVIPMGFASGEIPSIPANIVLVKNITIIGLYWGYYFGWGRQKPDRATYDRVRAAFAEMLGWVQQGILKPRNHQSFPLGAFADAFTAIADRTAVGRITLVMQDYVRDRAAADG